MTTIRVFLLDDHEIVRRGLRELLEAAGEFEVVGEAGTAEEALSRIPATRPQVAVLDVRLPDGDRLSVRRFQSLGLDFGMGPGFENIHWLLDEAFAGKDV